MCMTPGCTGHKAAGKGNAYTPKKATASKGGYKPSTRASTMSSFGKPSISKVSFSGRRY